MDAVTSPDALVRSMEPAPDAGDPIDGRSKGSEILGVVSAVRRNIVLVVSVIAATLLLGLVVTLLTTPRYTARGSLQVDQEAARVLNTEDVQPTASYQDAERALQTQVDVIKSRRLAERVVTQLRLAKDAGFLNVMGEKLPTTGGQRALFNAVVVAVQRNLSVSLPTNSRIIGVAFTSPDGELAARIVNTYTQGFITYTLERKYESSSYARDFLANQLQDAKRRLELSEQAVNDYARSVGLVRTEPATIDGKRQQGASVTVASLAQINEALSDARSARIAAEQKWRGVAGSPAASIPDVFGNLAYQRLLEQLAERRAALEQELSRHQEEFPTVPPLRRQMESLNTQLARFGEGIKSSIQTNYRIALEQEQALERQVDGLKSDTLAEQDRGVRYTLLTRETDTNRTLYDGLLSRYKEVTAQAGVTINNLSIVDVALAPSRPSSPRLLLNLAASLLVGILLAGILVFVKDQLDDLVRMPDDVERKLGLRMLGFTPRSEAGEETLDLLLDPKSRVAEAYNALRTTLLFSTTEGIPRRVFVTSSQPGEGKSTTSFALAHGLARLDKKVLLADLDLRRPSVHRELGLESGRTGVSSILTGQATLTDALIAPTAPGLPSFLLAGPIPPSPTELLSSAQLDRMLADLDGQFDVIILDGPPVLGLADAPILAAKASTVFVIEADRGHNGAAKAALRRLRAIGSPLLGAVLTKFDTKNRAYGYGSGYGYYADYYGYDKSPER